MSSHTFGFKKFEGFFSLIGRDKSDKNHYQFQSVELKETSFRIDGVFVPQTDDITYFVEVQFQRDSTFYARFFCANFSLFETVWRVPMARRCDLS
ncbi:MAG: DUF2887 domain-containing protein [Chloroherpetonaceae bacterium]